MPRILIIEDDRAIAEIERDHLIAEGMEVEIVEDGVEGLERGSKGGFDLILLDIMLPRMDGFAVCRNLRLRTDTPILMVTARQEDIDKIRGLGLGADDYIEKPFSPSVLVAFVKAHLARYKRLTVERPALATITIGDVSINTETRRVMVRGGEVELKRREFELLRFFMLHPDVVFSREALYERVWGADVAAGSATVPVHINRLREKIEAYPAHPTHIVTVWGAGYRYQAS